MKKERGKKETMRCVRRKKRAQSLPPSFSIFYLSPPKTLIPRPLEPFVFDEFPAAEKLPEGMELGLTGARAADRGVPPRAAWPRRGRAWGHGADVERESIRLHDPVELGVYVFEEEVNGGGGAGGKVKREKENERELKYGRMGG